jgi:hypothetical protein
MAIRGYYACDLTISCFQCPKVTHVVYMEDQLLTTDTSGNNLVGK